MKLLVLAGGSGSRLKSVLPDTPKALAPVGGVPFLALQLENWIDQGISSFVFLLHHQSDQILSFLDSVKHGLLNGCEVRSVIEPSPMDTGGAVAFAVRELGLTDDFLMTNADTWLGSGISQLTTSISPTIAAIYLNDTSRYGQVQFDHRFAVTAFGEKRASGVPGWINGGLCRLHPNLFEGWDGMRFSLEMEMFPRLVQQGQLNVAPIESDFIDIGVPEDYQRFCSWVAAGREGKLCN